MITMWTARVNGGEMIHFFQIIRTGRFDLLNTDEMVNLYEVRKKPD